MDKLDPTQQALLRLLRFDPRTGKNVAITVTPQGPALNPDVSAFEADRMRAREGYEMPTGNQWSSGLYALDQAGIDVRQLPGADDLWLNAIAPGGEVRRQPLHEAQRLGRRVLTSPQALHMKEQQELQRGVTALDERGEPVRTTLWSAQQHGWKVLPEGAPVPEVKEDMSPPMAPADQRPPQRQKRGDGMKALAALLGLNGGK